MAIDFDCPDCGKAFSVKDEQTGRRGKCPGCGQTFRVPSAPAEPSESPMISVAARDHPATLVVPNAVRIGFLAVTADITASMADGIARILVDGERFLLRLALYLMLMAGTIGYPNRPGDEDSSHEMNVFFGRLLTTASICTLAIVSRLPVKK